MNKRSAIITAGGLAASFVAGVAAVSANWGLGTPASSVVSATGPTTAKPPKPIVKHRRIVVHKKAPTPKGPSPTGPTIAVSGPTQSAPVVTTSGSHGAGGESDDGAERGGDD